MVASIVATSDARAQYQVKRAGSLATVTRDAIAAAGAVSATGDLRFAVDVDPHSTL